MDLEKSNILKRLSSKKTSLNFQPDDAGQGEQDPLVRNSKEVTDEIVERLKKSLLTSNMDNIKVYYSPNSITEKTHMRPIKISADVRDIE